MSVFILKKIKKNALLLLLSAVYFVNGFIYIPQQSVTADEADHLNYAVRLVKGHSEKIKPFDDASTMPISALNTIPRIIQQKLYPSLTKKDGGVSDIFAGRYITLLASFLIGLFIYKWSKELYGYPAGVFGFFLFVFCPNLNAHAGLVTTDAYSALFTLTAAYYFWKYLSSPSWRSLVLFGLNLGLAQVAKQSLTHLYFVFLILAVVLYAKQHALFKNFRSKLLKALIVAVINVVLINAAFLMKGTGTPLKQYAFRSAFFRNTQRLLKPIGMLPLPLPEPYITGLDLTKNIDEMGGGHPESSGKIYILGHSKEGSGFWYYYFVSLFFKTPLTILLCCVLLFIQSIRRRFTNFSRGEIIPFFIIVYLIVYFSFFYNSQVGIRHVLFLFPLLYVLISPIVYTLLSRKKGLALFICYTLATFYYYFPNLISYTNEFVLPKRKAYKILADSNLDYRQGYFWMRRYLEKHRDVQLPDSIPRPGKYIITVGDYLNLNNANNHNWLRRFEPSGQVHHCNLIFDISQSDLNH